MSEPSTPVIPDQPFLNQGFLTISGVPTHVITCGRWVDEPLLDTSPEKILILLIPGNPGAIEYYEEFMSALYEGLQRAVPIWGISHAGHVHPQATAPLPKLQGNEDLYNLEGQIKHKMAFINAFVPRDRQIVFIGHSIGCYISLELMKRMPQLKVEKTILLFPTIERMSMSPQGQWVWPIVTYFRVPTLLSIYALSYFSPQLQWRLLSWYFKDRPVPECVIKASMNMFQPECARLYMYMGKDELEKVTTLDVDTIQNNVKKLILYYGSKDQWCPLSYYEDIKELFPEADVRLCNHGFAHAFVLENSREVAALVARWVVEEVLHSSRDTYIKSMYV